MANKVYDEVEIQKRQSHMHGAILIFRPGAGNERVEVSTNSPGRTAHLLDVLEAALRADLEGVSPC